MSADYETLFPPRPFWFVSAELLTNLLHAELSAIMKLFAKWPDLRKLFDAPEATFPQRTACFELLAHCKVIETIDEILSGGGYLESPALSDEESTALACSQNLVSPDAPAWVREANDVAELLPFRIRRALPEPLRDEISITDPVKGEAARSAVKRVSTVEQLQSFTNGVLEQQLRRLQSRWSTDVFPERQMRRSSKRKNLHTRDALRMRRDKLIAEIAEVARTPDEFLQLMDERKVQPQPTWNAWPGSWTQAYKSLHLRKLIHQDKSRALSRVPSRRRK